MTSPLHPCARCAQLQRTCCQRAEILLTEGDVARIRAHGVPNTALDRAAQAFVEFRAPADPAYTELDPADPDWVRLTVRPDGTRRMLERPDDACVFLGPRGCVLPTDVRPLVCRIYPFTYTERGLAGESPDYCPTAVLAPQGEPMTQVLDMTAAEAEQWRSQLYAELRADAAWHPQ